MADERTDQQGGVGKSLKRRGILAAAGAVVAGIVAKQTALPVAAAAPMMIANTTAFVDNPVLGQTNLTGAIPTGQTILVANASTSAGNAYGFFGLGGGGFAGVGGKGADTWGAVGVYGEAGSGGFGGGTAHFLGTGVFGQASGARVVSGDQICGVFGNALGTRQFGVIEYTDDRVGVVGSALGRDANSVGVSGYANSGSGVVGTTYGIGVVAGVYGTSPSAYGVIGQTTAAGYSGLTAITGTTGVAALAATSTNANAYAAYFQGTTVVQGDFAVVGGNKSAAVKDASGQHRLVYCMESPESWFEDFGSGKLVGGTASVTLDKTFTEIAHTHDYGVFLTPEGESKGLYVTSKTATGFAVCEQQGGMSTLAFRYRVVARRKDIKGERLAKFEVPKIRMPDESKLPKPAPPRAPS